MKQVQNEQDKSFVWPVNYANHSNIWEAYEIFHPQSQGYYDKEIIPPRLFCQLIVIRENNFYPGDSKTYLDNGYRFFQVEPKTPNGVELTFEEFQNAYQAFSHDRNAFGELCYICKLAYEKIPKPNSPCNPTFETYNNYVQVYYPNYIADDVGAAFALWTKDGQPVVLIRLKCGCADGWDMVYPGEQNFIPLCNFSWRELANFDENIGEAVQIYPQKFFGIRTGVHKEDTWAIWGRRRPINLNKVRGPIAHERLRPDEFWARAFDTRY